MMKTFPALNLAISNAIFGTIGLFAVNAGLDPFVTVFWRCVFAILFLGIWCLMFGYLKIKNLSPKLLFRAALSGIGDIGSSVALFAAYNFITIGTATIVYHIQPFFVLIIGAVFFKESIKAFEVLWIIVAFIGLVLSTGVINTFGMASDAWSSGVGLALLAALLYAMGTIIGKTLGEQRPEVSTLMQTIMSALLLLPFAHLTQSIPAASWKWLVPLGVLHTGIAYVFMFSAFPHLRTPVIAVLAFIFPLVSVIVDWLAYGKVLHWPQAVGLLLIMGGNLGIQLQWGNTLIASRLKAP